MVLLFYQVWENAEEIAPALVQYLKSSGNGEGWNWKAALRAVNRSWHGQITPQIQFVDMANGDMHTLANSLGGNLSHVKHISVKLLYRSILDMNEEKGMGSVGFADSVCLSGYHANANDGHQHRESTGENGQGLSLCNNAELFIAD